MKNVKVSLFLLISQILYVLMSAVWLITALMSFMMFDSPEALTSAPTILIFLFVWLYPIALIASGVISWILYHKRKFKAATWTGLIPLLWVLPLIWLAIDTML